MATPPWYVITGGPCAGKSTVLEELARRGYRTEPEAARVYIEEALARGEQLEDVRRDELAFQRNILRIKVDIEKKLPKGETIFFDRGVHDSIAYYKLCDAGVDEELAEAVAQAHYRKAFLLDMVHFEEDHARTETAEEASQIHNWLERGYTEHGIPVVRVPVMPVEERAALILANFS